MKKIYSILLIIAVSLLPQYLIAQRGIPEVHNIGPNEYGGVFQNWDAQQDNRGVMYFANGQGILEYNGEKWRRFHTKDRTTVLSMGKDQQGRIYIGADTEVGYLASNKSGEVEYVDLTDKIPEEHRKFLYVWYTFGTEKGAYFITPEKIFHWDGKEFKVWSPEASFFAAHYVNNQLYVLDEGKGLCVLEGDEVKLVPGGELFLKHTPWALLPHEKGILAITTEGAFLNQNNAFTPFPTKFDGHFQSLGIYRGAVLPDGTYALATKKGGVLFMDQNGYNLAHLSTNNALYHKTVYGLFVDRQQQLWIMMEGAIAKLQVSSPISYFNQYNGLPGIAEDIMWSDIYETTIAVTNRGCYYLNRDTLSGNYVYKQVNKMEGDFSRAVEHLGNLLFMGTSGLYYFGSGQPYLIYSTSNGYELKLSEYDSTKLYIGSKNLLTELTFDSIWWRVSKEIEYTKGEIYSIQEDAPGKLWVSTRNNGISYVELMDSTVANIIHYDTTSGLPKGLISLHDIDNEMLLGTNKGIYSFDAESEKFKPSKKHGKELANGSGGVFLMEEDEQGRMWNIYKKHIGFLQDGKLVTNPFKKITFKDYYKIFPQNDSLIWIAGTDGVALYDYSLKEDHKQSFNTLISYVYQPKDTLFFGAYYTTDGLVTMKQPNHLKPTFEYENNSISFEFAAAYYGHENYTKYSYYLEGFDKDWSEWSYETKKEYTNIPEGKYKFRVKAKNIYGVVGKEAVYEFTVETPWYRTIAAYIGYVVLGLLFIFLLIKLYARRLERKNRVLEGIVTERTAEVVEQKTVIEKHRDEIFEQKRELEDSIEYAKTLQQAILPSLVEVKKSLPNHFIYYVPRDIVSGDFYWYAEKENKTFISAIDCTGHGVPGAFVSILGSNLLNQIVLEKHIVDPGQVLTELNRGVKNTFGREDTERQANDGMDLAFIAYDKQKNVVEFAGAKNPLILIRDGELIIYKADKMPIGGPTEHDYEFKTEHIEVKKGDAIYMFSDGYPDQFGGAKGKKFMIKNFKQLLLEMQNDPMDRQYEKLRYTMEQWRKGYEQIDDILVIGIQF
jgi:serine phosphatase RsbU (regulator of sigma subunit)/ligand-binding sensor domain-containing protein